MTSTHIFRRAWIERIAPIDEPYRHRHVRLGAEGFDRSWSKPEIAFAPNCACSTCNSGWMDRLDHAGEALLEAAVFGHPIRIERVSDHRTIASWATLVGLLLSKQHAGSHFSEARYREFGTTQLPFVDTRVWLAATRHQAGDLFRLNGFPRSALTNSGVYLYFSTLRINHLVVQAFIPPEPLLHPIAFERGAENRRFVREVWPSPLMPVSWPPEKVIPPSELEDFADAFIDDPLPPRA